MPIAVGFAEAATPSDGVFLRPPRRLGLDGSTPLTSGGYRARTDHLLIANQMLSLR